ncbi:hypothetical protein BU23DRAFT_496301 [Bimuria novae-zelandiae CBS 107.79]|uniref:Glycoside hydrolase 131 catalytic N-terminal domain-containing protein n=1 Tax=Bimuria novae-zelandiae CBS 107.79 TaxID=1447943 RepID=A0A6A5VRR3_9PLEO|nr:hypothetical protein BU23DRAFT_496301 [Bimuria novae-zelandiae CBS 107.79]
MGKFHLLANVAVALASPYLRFRDTVQCPIIFDGRVPHNFSTTAFDLADVSPYSTQYVKGENLTWSQIILLPNASSSRFDTLGVHRPLEVTINDHSLFRAGQRLQTGFRRAGLLLKNDKNAAGADAADQGVVTFHWSVKQDASKPLNLSHEYMNVWHEKADYSGNQFTFVGGVVLPADGGTGVDTPEEKNTWRIQDSKNKFLFCTPILGDAWQNFAVQLDYTNNTIQIFYSPGNKPLKDVTGQIPNDNAGGGQLQLGIAKKPTETDTVVWDGYQEPMPLGEGQVYAGVFVEDSSDGCISM